MTIWFELSSGLTRCEIHKHPKYFDAKEEVEPPSWNRSQHVADDWKQS